MDLRAIYRLRPEEPVKGDFGRVLVVGGSDRYAGAPAFNALAALRAGADLVHVIAPRRAADLVASYAPDLITIPVGGPHPTWDDVRDNVARADAIVIGGGVERSEASHRELRTILREAGKPTVIDAEALHALAADPSLVQGKRALLTPNPHEYAVLAGTPWPASADERSHAARELARRFSCAVVVKGRYEVVSDGERVERDDAGSPYLTKGGYGDLLAGAAGAFLARGASPFDAARAAAFLVGSAGELAAKELGESTLASDALAKFPEVIRRTIAS